MAISTPRTSKFHAKRRAREGAAEASALAQAQGSIPQELVDFAQKCQKHPAYFIETCLSVAPIEGGEIIPFRLNIGQRMVMDEVEKQLAEGRPIRVVVLKSRRWGISTLGQALAYWATSCFPHRNGMVVAHKKTTTAEIFRCTKLFWDADERQRLGPYNLRPEILNSNELAIRYDVDRKAKEKGRKGLSSNLLVESAEGTGVAVGLTLHALHASEFGKWQNPTIMAGLGIALSKTPGSIGLIESTAEGEGNLFHKTWVGAVSGKNEWAPVFLPWNLDPRWVAVVGEAERRNWEFTDKYERDLHEKHGLTLEQLKWRRLQLASPDMMRPGVKPEDVFKQEYPMTPDEAFLSSGKHFFLMEGVRALEESGKGVKPALYRANVSIEDIPADRRDMTPIYRPPTRADYGELAVWEEPQPNEDYVIGADVAQGLEDGDFSVGWVLKRSTLKYVARLKTKRCDADEFGQKLALLGWWYNTALVGAEINGPGVATNAALRRIRYSRVWFDRDIVKVDEPVHKYIGWRTSQANRRPVLERLEEEIRRLTIDMPAEDFYAEARTFVLVDTGSGTARPEATVGNHDDEIMSAAITLQLHIRGGAMRNVPQATPTYVPKVDFRKPKPQEKKRVTIRALEMF
jgi:hypothetical protein